MDGTCMDFATHMVLPNWACYAVLKELERIAHVEGGLLKPPQFVPSRAPHGAWWMLGVATTLGDKDAMLLAGAHAPRWDLDKALITAALSGSADKCSVLLQLGACCESFNGLPFLAAVWSGSMEACMLMLDDGCFGQNTVLKAWEVATSCGHEALGELLAQRYYDAVSEEVASSHASSRAFDDFDDFDANLEDDSDDRESVGSSW